MHIDEMKNKFYLAPLGVDGKAYSGYPIHTETGTFSMIVWEDGVLVLRDGKTVWTSADLPSPVEAE